MFSDADNNQASRISKHLTRREMYQVVDFQSIDDRSKLAGSNRLELLTFRLIDADNKPEAALYGINVFKVREIMLLPELIQTPQSNKYIAGIANIRGLAIPVVDLNRYCGAHDTVIDGGILVVTEFNGSTQGLLVHNVENIVQLAWSQIQEPPKIVMESHGNTMTAMSQMTDDQMLLILDVEKVLADTLGSKADVISSTEMPTHHDGKMVFFADDSLVARTQISQILTKMRLKYEFAKNGQEALEMLTQMASEAEAEGLRLSNTLCAIITDVEMPEMDGYVLTGKIKEDRRFDGIPVMMHTSLSAAENLRLGMKVGADAYIPKLRPKEFSTTLDGLLNQFKDAA